MTSTTGIVIPAYRPAVPTLKAYVRTLHDSLEPSTIRIELDAPGESVIDSLSGLPATVNVAATRRGKGRAITAGFEALDTDVVAFADADGSTPASELGVVIDAATEPAVDLAVGSRRHPDATVEASQSPSRQYLGDVFAWSARRLLAVSLYDYQCGAKAITADGWRSIEPHLSQPGFAWDVELIAIAGALDLAVREVPVTWRDHPDSTVPPIRTAVRLGRTLVSARYRAARLGDRLDSTDRFRQKIFGEPGTLIGRLLEEDGPLENDD